MILASDEFADQNDRFDRRGDVDQDGGKQVDPVDYGRAAKPPRAELLAYVSRLIKLRTAHPALAVNETRFLHVDLTPGSRVLALMRGEETDPVLIVANFSDWVTESPFRPGAEYVISQGVCRAAGERTPLRLTPGRVCPLAQVGFG